MIPSGARAETERNKWLAAEIVEVLYHGRDAGDVDALIDSQYIEHSPLPGQVPGLAGLKRSLPLFWKAFPDLRFTIEDVIAEHDRVVVRGTVTATHCGYFQGVAPTGRRVSWTAIDIFRFTGGKQVEHWGNAETPEILRQLREPSVGTPPAGFSLPGLIGPRGGISYGGETLYLEVER